MVILVVLEDLFILVETVGVIIDLVVVLFPNLCRVCVHIGWRLALWRFDLVRAGRGGGGHRGKERVRKEDDDDDGRIRQGQALQ